MSRFVTRAADGRSVVTRRIAGETILVPIAGGVGDLDAVYTLNDVASFIWERIDGRQSANAIAAAVSVEYDVTLAQAARDVDELLNVLIAAGLAVERAEAERHT
jgi:hypothetical protein